MPTKLSGIQKGRIVFSDEELETIRELYKTESCSDIADQLGVSAPTIRNLVKSKGFERAPGWDCHKYANRYTRNYKHNIRKT